MQRVREAHELFTLALDELRDGNAAPARDDFGDFVRVDDFLQKRRSRVMLQVVLVDLELFLELGDDAVLELGSTVVVAGLFGLLGLDARFLEARADAADFL